MFKISGPPADDRSVAAQAYRLWVRLGMPKGDLRAAERRAKAAKTRPKYDRAAAKLRQKEAELEAEDLKKRAAKKIKKRRICK